MPDPVSTFTREPIPDDVQIRTEPRPQYADPRLGIAAVALPAGPAPKHRLVTIGDSLTHGFQSGAIFNTHLSCPAIIAYEMGWLDSFRRPSYPGFGGLPLNIEFMVRDLASQFGDKIDWWEAALAVFRLRDTMDKIEDWWERGGGSRVPNVSDIQHNLGIYGWDLRDILVRTAQTCRDEIEEPKDQLFAQLVENANQRAALRVLDSARAGGQALTPLGAAAALGQDGGIETLVVMIGANNALGAVTDLQVKWSRDPGYRDLEAKKAYTVWRPTHFAAELDLVVEEVKRIDARHVIWGTVPHVTIAPIARGVGDKVRPDSRYFPYYTRPWIRDRDFDPGRDPFITEHEARAVDSAIDQYNEAIAAHVYAAREEGRDWYLHDVAGLLDRLASRRYLESPAARPPWWRPYELPPDLAALSPVPNSHFFASGPGGRTDGGLFSLDGVHPTTIAYGILARELMRVMDLAGVKFYLQDGVTERTGPIDVDFRRLLRLDTLISYPPRSLSNDMRLIGWLDESADFVRRMLRIGV